MDPYQTIHKLLTSHLQYMNHQARIAWLHDGGLDDLIRHLPPDQSSRVFVTNLLVTAYENDVKIKDDHYLRKIVAHLGKETEGQPEVLKTIQEINNSSNLMHFFFPLGLQHPQAINNINSIENITYIRSLLLSISSTSLGFATLVLIVSIISSYLQGSPSQIYINLVGISISLSLAIFTYLLTRLDPSANGNSYTTNEFIKEKTKLRHRVKSIVNRYFSQAVIETLPLAVIERPDLIIDRYDTLIESRNPRHLPNTTSILEIFFASNNESLLVLGSPGSGKTHVLFTLAQSLLEETHFPLPIILSLSKWQNSNNTIWKMLGKEETFNQWIVRQIVEIYSTSYEIAKLLLKQGDVVLVLDGLDTLDYNARENVVNIINLSLKDHSLNIVISCRTSKYENMSSKLLVDTAIEIQQLSEERIKIYLYNLHISVANNPWITQLARNPLFLTLIQNIFHNQDEYIIDNLNSGSRENFLDYYIKTILKKLNLDDSMKLKTYLTWLAYAMNETNNKTYKVGQWDQNWSNNNPLNHLLSFIPIPITILIFFTSLCISPIWIINQGSIPWGGIIFVVLWSNSLLGALLGRISWGMAIIPIIGTQATALVFWLFGILTPVELFMAFAPAIALIIYLMIFSAKITIQKLFTALKGEFPLLPGKWIELAEELSLLIQDSNKEYRFQHEVLQDYFAKIYKLREK